jgi:hypothetical protein
MRLITTDANLRYQQNLQSRSIEVLVAPVLVAAIRAGENQELPIP